jgi:hypothetical protein
MESGQFTRKVGVKRGKSRILNWIVCTRDGRADLATTGAGTVQLNESPAPVVEPMPVVEPTPILDRESTPVLDRESTPVPDRESTPIPDRESTPVLDRESTPVHDPAPVVDPALTFTISDTQLQLFSRLLDDDDIDREGDEGLEEDEGHESRLPFFGAANEVHYAFFP